jgi:hypothetical protein
MSTNEWVRERLGGYAKLEIEARREAVLELSQEGHSNREIAGVLGVDEGAVRNDKGAEKSAPSSNGHNENNWLDSKGAENSAAPQRSPARAGGRRRT